MFKYLCETVSLEVPSNSQIIVANNERISVEAMGTTKLRILANSTERIINVTDILHVP